MKPDSEKNTEPLPDKAGRQATFWQKLHLFLCRLSEPTLPLRQRAEGAVTAGHIGSILSPVLACLVFSRTEHTPSENPWLFFFMALFYGGAWVLSLLLVRWGFKTLNELDSE
jgi:hypothetical protein